MNRLSSLKLRPRTVAGLAVAVAAIYVAAIAFVTGSNVKAEDAKPAEPKAADTKAKDSKANDSKPEKKAEIKKLSGAELYQINCNRCHPERYPTEFNSAQWKTIMTHMRVRANLPAAQAKLILKYLQEDSGN
jgi:cytochrome c5